MIEPGAIVTVVGAGGTGKTTLAVDVGYRLLRQFGGGVWFCDLTRAAHDDVVGAAHDAVSGTGREVPVDVDELHDLLGGRSALLVLDNCEHVVNAARDFVERLATASGGVAVLATSREPLQCLGERIVRIEGLAHHGTDSAAVELFLTRAWEVASLEPVDDVRNTAVAIVDRLDGLPLAIELAVPACNPPVPMTSSPHSTTSSECSPTDAVAAIRRWRERSHGRTTCSPKTSDGVSARSQRLRHRSPSTLRSLSWTNPTPETACTHSSTARWCTVTWVVGGPASGCSSRFDSS